jgi:hypothetical protein
LVFGNGFFPHYGVLRLKGSRLHLFWRWVGPPQTHTTYIRPHSIIIILAIFSPWHLSRPRGRRLRWGRANPLYAANLTNWRRMLYWELGKTPSSTTGDLRMGCSRHHTSNHQQSATIESRVKTPVGTVLPRLEQWPYPQLCNTSYYPGRCSTRQRASQREQMHRLRLWNPND